ncbi:MULTISPECIES: UvrD-helicase domain-containing protein [Mesoflavibacter]|uniref:UvrD-helicase domain-containing protein n=1 Tax=Mesoflavibacter TaxID=444051 RepID=UPI000D102FA1|nr:MULTISPECIES: UvrD-helicase domain-containing protein [unclassified Mesoflavibacter]QIJ88985.1 ATP-dependent helicase [Mesoflavibacter sp. HG96]QIJ91713.1 ATP-dependent helicase [Mesoflavibacter sp. HG37]
MNTFSPFKVYNASAGSGKTFNLVKSYLKLLFKNENIFAFKHILAMTFTNKAVGEMKDRLLKTLDEFSKTNVLDGKNDMFNLICAELDLSPIQVHTKSKNLLNTIMHNYAAFDITTIDGFNHKLIRTFAYDLDLPVNFEVDLDTDSLLQKAVDNLISKAGTDSTFTKILVAFALEKADDDKSWDITSDLFEMSKKLINENDIPHLNEAFKDKTLEDFEVLKTKLIKQIKVYEEQIINNAKRILKTFETNQLTKDDFYRGTLFNHFDKAYRLDTYGLYNNQLEKNIEENKVYNKNLDPNKKDIIDQLLSEIGLTYKTIKATVYNLTFLKAIYKNIIPLSVLNAIKTELQSIKDEENKLLISEFNTLISEEIKNQPTPFIYERIGEKFRHYFIDEFQDTSLMQWNNLIPLMENALTGQNLKGEIGTAMIVGDAKQAIYRWRGGKAEQFIELTKQTNPFPVNKDVIQLEYNYRSCKNIVDFNNSFFNYTATTSFRDQNYAELYKDASQKHKISTDGYVNLTFLDYTDNDDKVNQYNAKTLEIINNCIANGFSLKDICILTRKRKDGVSISKYLAENNVAIISSETMLINNSEEVKLITNVLRILENPNNLEVKANILHYIANTYDIANKHDFISNALSLNEEVFFKTFNQFEIFFDANSITQLSLYDTVESIARQFKLIDESDAYIQFYLDLVLDYSQKNITDISGFLTYYDNKKDKLSIVSPENQEAVQIMTIHKSKGLEFPVVIFPYADLDIYRDKKSQIWFPLEQKDFNGFSKTLINVNKDLEMFGDQGAVIYNQFKSQQELDQINLLYVALTRPEEQLYIISKNETKITEPNSFSKLFIAYLQEQNIWEDNKYCYEFGNPKRELNPELKKDNTITNKQFISVDKKDHNIKIITKSGYLWDTNQEDAIEKGNIIHDIMANVKTKEDIPFAVNQAIKDGIINNQQATIITSNINQIVNHSKLTAYYTDQYLIYNEKDIILSNGQLIRPDRLAIKDNEAIIIDYKTGAVNNKYEQQLQLYTTQLEMMGYKVSKKILVYINENIDVIEFNNI